MGALLLAGVLSGCDDGGSGGSGGSGEGGAGGSGGSGGGGAEVAACKEVAAQLKGTCDETVRECLVDQYATYCESQNTAVVTEALDCLLSSSGGGGCRVFSDPSGASACVEEALSKLDTTAAEAVAQNIAAKCPDVTAGGMLYRSEPPLALASSAQLQTLDTCVADAADCMAAAECYEAAFPEIWDVCN